jgi:hypothetical protein
MAEPVKNTFVRKVVRNAAREYHLLVLPTAGAPYIFKTVKSVDDTALRAATQGDFHAIQGVCVNPMFAEEDPRWRLADRILQSGLRLNIYENSDAYKCCENMGVLWTLRFGRLPHLFGDIVVVVSNSLLKLMSVRAEQLSLVGEVDEDGVLPLFEPEDEEEEAAKMAECARNDWDTRNIDDGFIYRAVM